jgi:subtilisin family serine protease
LLVQFWPNAVEAQRNAAALEASVRIVETIHTETMRASGAGVLQRVVIDDDIDMQSAIDILSSNPNVAYAEPNYIHRAAVVSNDTFYTSGALWGMYGDDAPQVIGPAGTTNRYGSQSEKAWNDDITGNAGIFVGVIDEGIDTNHPDLAGNIWVNPFEIAGDGIDNDGNGYIDDVHGWDFFSNDNSVYDGTSDDHGTHVAGTIGAKGGNGVGVAGVAWDVTMISLKFLGPEGGFTSDAIKAVDYVTDLKTRHGLNVVATNNSWGGGGYSQALHDAIIRSAKSNILFVASAGNGGSDFEGDSNDSDDYFPANYNTAEGTSTESPASYDAVISVASIDPAGSLSSFSNYGSETVDIGAPGESVWSTLPGDTYGAYYGTSMAAPHVTGAIALYASSKPVGTSAASMKQAILNAANPTPSLMHKTVTDGRLDTYAAVASDNIPPQISGLVASPSSRLFSVSWVTNEAATTELFVGVEPGSLALVSSQPERVLEHTVAIANLAPQSTYYFQVRSRDASGNATATEVESFSTGSEVPILFVDDDFGRDYDSFYTNALDANGYSFETWDVAAFGVTPASAFLSNYEIVIWNTGFEYAAVGSGLGGGEQAAIAGYLDGGGRMFLSGQDIFYNTVESSFRENYLKVESYTNDVQFLPHLALGVEAHPIGSGLALPIDRPGPDYFYIDAVTPVVGASGWLTHSVSSTSSPFSAISYRGDYTAGDFGIVFTTTPFEAISTSQLDPNNQNAVMKRIVDYLLDDKPVDIVLSSVDYLTEGNAGEWEAFADGASASTSNNTEYVKRGTYSIKLDTLGGFDTGVRYHAPAGGWDLSSIEQMAFWVYGDTPSPVGWQGNQPFIKLLSPDGSLTLTPSIQLMPNRSWAQITIPLLGDGVWQRQVDGNFAIDDVRTFEIHQDTWDSGFVSYYDDLRFIDLDQPPSAEVRENLGPNAVVGHLRTADPNFDDTFTYAFVSGDGSQDNASFIIDGSTLRAVNNLDYEVKNAYSIRLRSTDSSGQFIEKAIPIRVIDYSEATVLTIAETSVGGTVLSPLTNSGTWFHPEGSAVALSASLGDVTRNDNGTWSWSFVPSQVYTGQVVTITANDERGLPSQVQFTIEVIADNSDLYLLYAAIYTDSNLQQPGLVGTYINQSLHLVSSPSDWRSTQSVAGTRIDTTVEFLNDGWGQRSSVGLTHGSDANWENFSVQWDGFLQVASSGQRFATVSDDGSRMWIDLNRDGTFSFDELYDNNWGGFQGMRTGDRTPGIPAGVYPIRIQYYEQSGGNSFALAGSPFVPKQFEPTPTNPVQVVKVLVINFDPRVPSEGNQKLHEVFHWSDPMKLASQFENDIEWATGGGVDIQIVEWRERDAFPIFGDGFRYNPDEYVQFRRSNSGWNPGTLDFRELVDQENLVPLVNSGAIDELWLFGDHYFSLLGEAWMAGPNSFFINGPTMSDVGFDRAISGYGFNYERSVGEMLHNLSHRIENHGQRSFGSWNLANPVTAWDRYSSNYNDTLTGPYGVGTCHVPANADAHYDYDDTRIVMSTAHDFPNYPNMSGETREVSRDTWAFGPAADTHRDYMNWYLAMMPRNDGTDANGRTANWYEYIWDYNSYEAGTGRPRQEDVYGSGDKVKVAGAASHEVAVRYYDVEGLNLDTIGNDDVTIIGPGNISLPATFTGLTRSVDTTAGEAVTVTYRFNAPGGSWDVGDNGLYRIRTNANSIRDILGTAFPALDVGQFEVAIPRAGQINVRDMLSSGAATVTHTALDIGPITSLFDDQSSTLIRTPNINPAVVTLSFQSQQTVTTFRTYFSHAGGNPAYRYSVEAANTLTDLNNRIGTYQLLIDARGTASDRYDEVTLPQSVTGRVFRLTGTRLTGDNYVHINEWQMIGDSAADNAAPTVSLQSVPAPVMGGQAQFLTLAYEDQLGVRVPSLGNGDIVILGPNGITIDAVFYDVDGISNGRRREATYWFIPPGGSWNEADYGLYTIIAKAGSVTDILYQSHPQDRVVGTFSFDVVTPPTLSIQALDASKPEGNSGSTGFTFTASRLGNKSAEITVNYAVSAFGIHPASSDDFIGGFPTGTITFPPNVTSVTVTIPVQGDILSERDEGFRVVLSNPSGNGILDVVEAQGLIKNDDIVDVTNRRVYYRGSSFQSSGGIAGATDTSKLVARASGESQTLSYQNIINTSRGINGMYFDLAGITGASLSASDFAFRMSPTGSYNEGVHPPSNWANAPAPSAIVVTPGTGSAPARVRIDWPDNAISNRWLQIKILATANTGLVAPQVFYLGHLYGEVNGLVSNGVLSISIGDVTALRPNVGFSATVTSPFDLDKNGTVSIGDITGMRPRVGVGSLRVITIPPSGSSAEGEGMMAAPPIPSPTLASQTSDDPRSLAIPATREIRGRWTDQVFMVPQPLPAAASATTAMQAAASVRDGEDPGVSDTDPVLTDPVMVSLDEYFRRLGNQRNIG